MGSTTNKNTIAYEFSSGSVWSEDEETKYGEELVHGDVITAKLDMN